MQSGVWIDIGEWVWGCVGGGGDDFSPVGFWRQGIRALLGVGGLACRHGCVVLVCCWRRLLADRHSLPFPGGGGGVSPTLGRCTHPSHQTKKMPLQET